MHLSFVVATLLVVGMIQSTVVSSASVSDENRGYLDLVKQMIADQGN